MKNDEVSDPIVPIILIVDDVPANLKILANLLEHEGYAVRPVLSGAHALESAEKEKPDLILLDIMMPDMDGFEVCRLIKENQNLNDVPIIFISALNSTKDIVRALTTGGVDYITKPFRAEEVKARAATHLKLSRQRNEIEKQKIELQKLNATKDKFFSIIAHDLRGPFSGFLGLTEIMVEGLSDMTMDEIQEIAEGMKNSATNLSRLLENLLQWAQVQRGLIPFNPKSVALLTIVNDSLEILYEAAINKGIDINCDISDNIKVFADSILVQTVIRNLVSNSIKFTNKGGKISISAKVADDNSVEIAIKDTGIGMSNTILENLFRLDAQTGRKGTQGEPTTGLGLMLCKEFVEKHGGKLWVESDSEGKSGVIGSTFYFNIPNNNT